jgi:hypothetical protein
MSKKHCSYFGLVVIGIFVLSACQPSLWGVASTPTPVLPIFLSTATPTEPAATDTAFQSASTAAPIVDERPLLWAGAAAPSPLREKFLEQGFQLISERESADIILEQTQTSDGRSNISTWTFALVAPFPTLLDGVTSQELFSAWNGSSFGPFNGIPLLMDQATLAAFSTLWGEPAPGAVRIVPSDELLDAAWTQMLAWALVPFEWVEPKWKVLTIDGQSPIQKGFNPSAYPLSAKYELTCSVNCPPVRAFQNRDADKLATVVLTGVTALVRATAATMERRGVLHPGEFVREIFREADILHISNEVPFYSQCPTPNPVQPGLRFCSSPRYIELLLDLGTDVVELSGDHFADYGAGAMLETIQIYKDHDMQYYGGGLNLEDGRKPLLLEVNGNKLMFIGCNGKQGFATARDTVPGAVQCDYDYVLPQIAAYRAQGWLPIFTVQYYEFDTANATSQQMIDFRKPAEAGAVIVSGSQAHVPQTMEFYNGAFIHYGLGNLFFDQYNLYGSDIRQKGFITRHVFYDGRYLGVEVIPTFLPDYARPRLMTSVEQANFLREYFALSGWDFPQASR